MVCGTCGGRIHWMSSAAPMWITSSGDGRGSPAPAARVPFCTIGGSCIIDTLEIVSIASLPCICRPAPSSATPTPSSAPDPATRLEKSSTGQPPQGVSTRRASVAATSMPGDQSTSKRPSTPSGVSAVKKLCTSWNLPASRAASTRVTRSSSSES